MQYTPRKTIKKLGALTFASVWLLSSCSTPDQLRESAAKVRTGDVLHSDPIDPSMNLTRDDYRHLAAPKSGSAPLSTSIEKDAPPIPKLAEILAAPRPPKIGETQLVSIAVTDDVPLKDVLLELAKLADVDIELESGITGGIEFIAKDKPFNEVIDRIANLADLRYTMKGNVLRVERDTPFIKSYSVDFLNQDRDSDSAVNLSTNVLSSGGGGSSGSSGGGGSSSGGSSSSSGGGGGGGLNTGSTSSVKSKTSGDFWKSLEAGVQQVLAYQPAQHVSATTMQAETESNVLTSMTGTNTPATPGVPGAPITPGAPAAPAPAPVRSAPAAVPVAAAAKTGDGTKYTINRQAGVITMNATSKQHELMELMLERLKKNASAQVLIEAKIIEVDLNDQYASGVNWQILSSRLGSAIGVGAITTAFPLGAPASSITPTGSFVQFAASNDSTNILQLLEAFGTIRTLSSPRLHAINNQQSTLTFATNHVYFSISVTQATTTAVGNTAQSNPATFSSTTNTVPIGIMMTMMPSVDLDNNEVTLAVRPTLSTLIDSVDDPGFELELAQAAPAQVGKIHNQIPEIQVRELDSTLKLKSGQTMVIGGLMQQEANDTDFGVPFLSSIPIIGNAFKSVAKSSHNKELVLLIKATIVNSGGSLNATDKNIFHKFSDDPRPVSF